MSHFTVTVKLSAERLARHSGDMNAALSEMLEPYNENGGTKVFVDKEDEERKRWETESTTRVCTPEGNLLLPWHDRFRVPGSFGMGSGTHRTPDDCAAIEVPFRETYPTFEVYCADWLGQKPDPTTGRIGHWTNGEAKWDWWTIGGRWTGFYPLKHGLAPVLGKPGAFDNKPDAGRGDIVRVSDLDLDAIATETREGAEEFYEAWVKWCDAPTNDFDSPRSRAITIGLCRVVQGPADPVPGEVSFSWGQVFRVDDVRKTWTDVCRVPTRDAFLAEHIDHFNPIATYAALDDNGWHAPGEMGWFGCSTDSPDEKGAFVKAFVRKFIKTAKSDDLLVVVDCHI